MKSLQSEWAAENVWGKQLLCSRREICCSNLGCALRISDTARWGAPVAEKGAKGGERRHPQQAQMR
eukprot:7226797-Prymnesium_polylepis.1